MELIFSCSNFAEGTADLEHDVFGSDAPQLGYPQPDVLELRLESFGPPITGPGAGIPAAERPHLVALLSDGTLLLYKAAAMLVSAVYTIEACNIIVVASDISTVASISEWAENKDATLKRVMTSKVLSWLQRGDCTQIIVWNTMQVESQLRFIRSTIDLVLHGESAQPAASNGEAAYMSSHITRFDGLSALCPEICTPQ